MLGNRIRQIRLDLGWSVEKTATQLGVSQMSVSNWEADRNKMPLERLQRFSEVTGFPVSYILGENSTPFDLAKPLPKAALPAMHRRPVWTHTHGWGLVNQATRNVTLADGKRIPFESIDEDIFVLPPALTFPLYGYSAPLTIDEIRQHVRVWVEPIGTDPDLNAEVRGWYHPHESRFVANEIGIRFYLDTYGAKWLAFPEQQ